MTAITCAVDFLSKAAVAWWMRFRFFAITRVNNRMRESKDILLLFILLLLFFCVPFLVLLPLVLSWMMFVQNTCGHVAAYGQLAAIKISTRHVLALNLVHISQTPNETLPPPPPLTTATTAIHHLSMVVNVLRFQSMELLAKTCV